MGEALFCLGDGWLMTCGDPPEDHVHFGGPVEPFGFSFEEAGVLCPVGELEQVIDPVEVIYEIGHGRVIQGV